jgi:hypothetical protein
MHSIVFKLALAAILATAIFFMLATTFSQVSDSANATVSNIEAARLASLNDSARYIQR